MSYILLGQQKNGGAALLAILSRREVGQKGLSSG